jgi:hypothetical protein
LQFYLILADFGLKVKAIIILSVVIILASSDQNLINKGSLDSSRQDELNGGRHMTLGSIYAKKYIKTYFGRFGHYLVIYRCYTHELATIRRVDTVIYLERGRLLAQGTFDEVRSALPRFDHQANLLGL